MGDGERFSLADKYEPELNTTMMELAEYYRTAIIPVWVCSPKNENMVDGTVGFAFLQIIAALPSPRGW
jgi:hypothetical protein